MPAKPSATTVATGNYTARYDSAITSPNPEMNRKIDTYIMKNPKFWAYVQAMPRERLERTVALNEVRALERQKRFLKEWRPKK